MSFNVQRGEPLVLRVLLPEEDDTKYIKATLKDEKGIELSGSPFTLINQGLGEYTFKDEVNLLFPNDVLEVVAIYRIYDDNQFLIPTLDYSQQLADVFRSWDVNIAIANVDLGPEFNTALIAMQNLIDDALKLRDDINIEIEDQEDVLMDISDNEEPMEVIVDEDDEIVVDTSDSDRIDLSIDADGSLEVVIEEDIQGV